MNEKLIVEKVNENHFDKIQGLCSRVYPFVKPWTSEQLKSHSQIFPEGQMIVIDPKTNLAIGYAASLVLNWSDYEMQDSWKDFTDGGFFTNHDIINGKTLYGAEIMVDPKIQGRGIGSLLYVERSKLVKDLGLLRIRAGARLRGFSKHEDKFSTAKEYVRAVVEGKVLDPTLTFQIKRGFKVLALVSGYLAIDPESKGYAAVIEWLNPDIAEKEHFDKQESNFKKNFLL